jgi:hypothetical protein
MNVTADGDGEDGWVSISMWLRYIGCTIIEKVAIREKREKGNFAGSRLCNRDDHCGGTVGEQVGLSRGDPERSCHPHIWSPWLHGEEALPLAHLSRTFIRIAASHGSPLSH